MNGAQKFLFDRSFDVIEEPEGEIEDETEEAEPEEVVPSFSEEEMNAAKGEAFAAGKEEGIQEASATTEREILGSLSALGGRFGEVFKAQDETNASILKSAISIANGIVRKVFPHLNERHGLGEIERMVITIVERILEEPRIVIYLNPELVDPFTERLSTLTAQASYKGEVQVVAGEDIPSGDCRVVWGGGGAKRDTEELWQEIDEIVKHNLAGADEDSSPEAPVTDEGEPGAPEEAETAEEAEKDDSTAEAPPPPDGAEDAAETTAETAAEAPPTDDGEPGAPEEAETVEAAEIADTTAEAQDSETVEPGPEDVIVDDGMDDRPEPPTDIPLDTPVENPDEEPEDEKPEPPVDGPETPGADDTATDPEDA